MPNGRTLADMSAPVRTKPLTRRQFATGVAASAGALALGCSRPVRGAPARPVGFALVGLGKLAQTQLVPALRKTTTARLTALVSGHPDKARRIASDNGVPERSIYTYETFDRLAENPDVDVVYVVLPNAMHAEYTIRAARAGKHVYCEKPMAVSPAECEQMIAACRDARRQLGSPTACTSSPTTSSWCGWRGRASWAR